MNKILIILDYLWPLTPAKPKPKPYNDIKRDDIYGDDVDLLMMKYKEAQSAYELELNRMKVTENKANVFISTISFLATIVIGISTMILNSTAIDCYKILMTICTFLLTIYMASTILFSIYTLQRVTIYVINPAGIAAIKDSKEYFKENIADYINSEKRNEPQINRKVDYVIKAQRHFKRAIFTILAYVTILLIYIIHKSGWNLGEKVKTLLDYLGTFTFSLWYMIISSILLVIAFIMLGTSLLRIRKISKRTDYNPN